MPSVRCMQKVGMGNKGQATNWKQGHRVGWRSSRRLPMGGEVTECAQAENDLRWTGRSGQLIMALQ